MPNEVQQALQALRQQKQGTTTTPQSSTVTTQQPSGGQNEVQQALAQIRAQKPVQPKQEGFFEGMAKGIARSFAEPITAAYNVVKAAPDVVKGLTQQISGNTEGAQQSANAANTELAKSRDIPFLGSTKPAFVEGSMAPSEPGVLGALKATGSAAKEVVGRGADIASNFIGAEGVGAVAKQGFKGAAIQAAKTGLKEGAVVGGLSGFGNELQKKDSTLGSVTGNTVLGTVAGAAGGAVLGAGGAVVKKGVVGAAKVIAKPFQSIETRTTQAINDAIDKGLKPSVKGNAVKKEVFRTKATQAFHVINEYKPTLAREGEEAIQRNPETRAEMLDAVSQAKKQVFHEYDNLARESNDAGAKFNPSSIESRLDAISNDKAYNPEIRNYAQTVKAEISELRGENMSVVQARIQDLNSSLAGYFENRVPKAKAQIDASTAALMRDQTDKQINSLTGGHWQDIRNKYGALSTIERDLERQVAVEARKAQKGLLDFTDIFTGGDLLAGVVTQNPALIAKGAAGKGVKEIYKYLNDPNRYIKNAFDLLSKQPVAKATRVRPKIAGLLPERATPGLSVSEAQMESPGIMRGRQALKEKSGPINIKPNIEASQKAAGVFKPRETPQLTAGNPNMSTINQGRPISVLPKNMEHTGSDIAAQMSKPVIHEGQVVAPKLGGEISYDKHGTPLSQNGKSLGDPVEGGIYYHGTIKENKPTLIKNGFDPGQNKKGFAEQPEALYVGSYSEASMYGDDMVGVRVKPGEKIKTLSINNNEWGETIGKSKSAEQTGAALRELRSRGYDAINSGNEIEILNLKKFDIIDAKKEKSLFEQVTGKKPPVASKAAGVLKQKTTGLSEDRDPALIQRIPRANDKYNKYSSIAEALKDPEFIAKQRALNEKGRGTRVTKTSNNLYHTTSAENIDSIAKNGLTSGNKPRFEGVSSSNKISFGANEKTASYYGKSGDIMIRTKSKYVPSGLEEDLLAGGKGAYTSTGNIPPEMLEVKQGSKWVPLKDYVAPEKKIGGVLKKKK